MIYFIKCHCSVGYIKIGYTSCGTARVSGLQTSTPYTVTLLRMIRGDQKAEREMHRRFAHLHERGEWFRPDAELLAYIDGLENETPPPQSPEQGDKVLRRLLIASAQWEAREAVEKRLAENPRWGRVSRD